MLEKYLFLLQTFSRFKIMLDSMLFYYYFSIFLNIFFGYIFIILCNMWLWSPNSFNCRPNDSYLRWADLVLLHVFVQGVLYTYIQFLKQALAVHDLKLQD